MDKLTAKLDKIKVKVDLKLILTLVDALMGILRGLIEAKQGDTSAI